MPSTRAKLLNLLRKPRRGMRRVEVCIPAGDVAVIRKAEAILRNPTEGATRLRRFLGFETESDRTKTALDIFAMPAPIRRGRGVVGRGNGTGRARAPGSARQACVGAQSAREGPSSFEAPPDQVRGRASG